MTTMNYSYEMYTPVDNTGTALDVWKSAYKNLRFTLPLQQILTLSSDQAANLPGLSYSLYGTVDFWRVLLYYNGLQDPIQDVYVGMTFLVPTQAGVVSWLSGQQNTTPNTVII
jgi:hypothetical protein